MGPKFIPKGPKYPFQMHAENPRTPHTNVLFRNKMTYSLRIPLVTRASRLPLEETLKILRDDKLTAAIPPSAWRSVDSLSISMGVLSLHTRDRLAKAREVMENLNLASNLGGEVTQPLSVTLRGLSSGTPGQPREHTTRLYLQSQMPRQ